MSRKERLERLIFLGGGVLLIAYLFQAIAQLEWPWLAELQARDTYKIGSGLVLAAYIAFQWSGASRYHRAAIRHKVAGAAAPLVLYLHAARFGYGYLLLLAALYLGTSGLGLLHAPVVSHRARWLFTAWFVVHLSTSVALVMVGGYHVVIALAYE